MMDEDIDWTWQLGDAVVNQQADVIAAVESFRDLREVRSSVGRSLTAGPGRPADAPPPTDPEAT